MPSTVEPSLLPIAVTATPDTRAERAWTWLGTAAAAAAAEAEIDRAGALAPPAEGQAQPAQTLVVVEYAWLLARPGEVLALARDDGDVVVREEAAKKASWFGCSTTPWTPASSRVQTDRPSGSLVFFPSASLHPSSMAMGGKKGKRTSCP